MKFVEVLLPLPLTETYTYAVPQDMADVIQTGSRVIVPFGRKKFYTGIVRMLHSVEPKGFEVKPIALLLDEGRPVVRHPQLKLWDWISDYYLCTQGDVYRAAVPSGLKVESETFVELNDSYEEEMDEPLKEREAMVVHMLQHSEKRVTIADIEKATGFRGVPSIISSLLQKGAVIISERLVEKYRIKFEKYVKIAASPGDMEALREMFASVQSAPKQELAFQTLVSMSRFTHPTSYREVSRRELSEKSGVTLAVITALEKKGLIEIYKKKINRFKYTGAVAPSLPRLTPVQGTALTDIYEQWLEKSTVLLHGVTSSGKTELYMHLIAKVLDSGRQALYLVPEIALTTQLAHRLQRYFGDKVVIYHSKFSDNERVDIWRMMLDDSQPRVILGARSSLFLPFAKLGVVIVDEEHEASYKQAEPAPRYNARDSAIVLASMHGAKVLLGSATPAVETYYKATEGGKYGLVKLTERYEGAPLPAIEISDMSVARKRGHTVGILTPITRQRLEATFKAGRQSLLFIPRRGYAPVSRCRMCAYVPKCHYCDVAMTYHKSRDLLVCHYCGFSEQIPKVCPACKEPAMEIVGYGSERVESDLGMLLPDARVLRMDLDTTRNKDSYESIIEEFSSGAADILVGTQMVTKGLDFSRVDNVAVINADSLINFPDFRSTERAFSLLSQVAGRAGRRAENPGVVTIQTHQPSHKIFEFVKYHAYDAFYEFEIQERRQFQYPPFSRIINMYIKHSDKTIASALAYEYGIKLRELFGNRVNGPEEPPVGRIQSLYIQRLMLKIEIGASMAKVRKILIELRNRMHSEFPDMRRAVVYCDVDPQ